MTAEIQWVTAATTDDLWEGYDLDVEVEGEQVLLVHVMDNPSRRTKACARIRRCCSATGAGTLTRTASNARGTSGSST